MTPDELKKSITATLTKNGSSQLYLVMKSDDKLIVKLADIDNKNTDKEIYRMFRFFLHSSIIANEDLNIRKLSVADESPNVLYEYDYENYPEELKLFKEFNVTNSIDNFDHFNFKTDDISSLFGYIIRIGSRDDSIILFKKHYPVLLINRDSFLLGLIKSTERFTKLDGQDILRLNDDAQLLRVKDKIFVLDLKVLERNMGFSDLIQREANKAIEAIKELGVIDDIEVLRDELDELSFARKLSKVKRSSPIFTLGITKEAIIKFTKETPELIGKFKYTENGDQIKLATKKSKNAFIKLMNDSFLRSELTKKWYEATAKDDLNRGPK